MIPLIISIVSNTEKATLMILTMMNQKSTEKFSRNIEKYQISRRLKQQLKSDHEHQNYFISTKANPNPVRRD